MLDNITVSCHSSIKFNMEKVIYLDPYKIDGNYNDADIIFITHDHYDHYSEEDIDRIKKGDTIIIAPKNMREKLLNNGFKEINILLVEPNKKYIVNEIPFETVPAYNLNKEFHPKENGWVGYIIRLNTIRYYIAGDTDITEENKKVKCDVAFIPVGGKFTMDYKEASCLVNEIKPQIVVPIHYGTIIGTKQEAIEFSKLLDSKIKCNFLIK